MGKKDGSAATNNLYPPIESAPPSVVLIFRYNGHPELDELFNSTEGIGFRLRMSVTPWVRVYAFGSTP